MRVHLITLVVPSCACAGALMRWQRICRIVQLWQRACVLPTCAGMLKGSVCARLHACPCNNRLPRMSPAQLDTLLKEKVMAALRQLASARVVELAEVRRALQALLHVVSDKHTQ
jgi:hypothetical protein